MLTSPTYNTYPSHPYPSQQQTTSYPSLTSTHNTQISSNIPNLVQLNTSPIKTSNTSNDNVTVHYIGGHIIRESNHPFSSNENMNAKENTEQIRCTICQRIDYIQRFFDQENKFCSQLCSLKSNENKIPIRVKMSFYFKTNRFVLLIRLLKILLHPLLLFQLKNQYHYHLIMVFQSIQVNGVFHKLENLLDV